MRFSDNQHSGREAALEFAFAAIAFRITSPRFRSSALLRRRSESNVGLCGFDSNVLTKD